MTSARGAVLRRARRARVRAQQGELRSHAHAGQRVRVKRAIKGGILANMLGRAALSTLNNAVFRGRRSGGGRASGRKSKRVRAEAQTPGVVPPPAVELEPEPPLRAPSSSAGPSGLLTSYPNRSEWEADVSERAREEIHEGNRPPRTKGPTREAD
jgi:hypothetical protein